MFKNNIIISILILSLSLFITGCSTPVENTQPKHTTLEYSLANLAGDMVSCFIEESLNQVLYSNYDLEDIFKNDIENLEINKLYIGKETSLEDGLHCIYRYQSKKSKQNYKLLKSNNIKQHIWFYENETNMEDIKSFFDYESLIPSDLKVSKDNIPDYFITPINVYVKDGLIKLIRLGAYESDDQIAMDKLFVKKEEAATKN